LRVNQRYRYEDLPLAATLGGAVYAATRRAVRARIEVKPYNIRTTVIPPGAVATELPDSVTEPDAPMSQPEDVDINEILFRPTRQEL
jgi:NADP-dependent 3-hydroxy acid dehydrogenase YdfG